MGYTLPLVFHAEDMTVSSYKYCGSNRHPVRQRWLLKVLKEDPVGCITVHNAVMLANSPVRRHDHVGQRNKDSCRQSGSITVLHKQQQRRAWQPECNPQAVSYMHFLLFQGR